MIQNASFMQRSVPYMTEVKTILHSNIASYLAKVYIGLVYQQIEILQ